MFININKFYILRKKYNTSAKNKIDCRRICLFLKWSQLICNINKAKEKIQCFY